MRNDLTCFLIDDDIDDQEIFEIALNSSGRKFKYISSNNCKEALEKLNNDQFSPDYIFLDLNLPRMSGKKCLEEIKNNPRTKNIPVIIYSTSAEQEDIEETKQLGAAHFITKPSSVRQLSGILTRFFQGNNLPFLINDEN